jgi:hypothetical protein
MMRLRNTDFENFEQKHKNSRNFRQKFSVKPEWSYLKFGLLNNINMVGEGAAVLGIRIQLDPDLFVGSGSKNIDRIQYQ